MGFIKLWRKRQREEKKRVRALNTDEDIIEDTVADTVENNVEDTSAPSRTRG